MANKFDYETFNGFYTNIKDAVGEISVEDTSTIGGTINYVNKHIKDDLAYASNSVWASSKLTAWSELYPGVVASYNNLTNLLDTAKQDADDYHRFEQEHMGMSNAE